MVKIIGNNVKIIKFEKKFDKKFINIATILYFIGLSKLISEYGILDKLDQKDNSFRELNS